MLADPLGQCARLLDFLGVASQVDRIMPDGRFLHRNPAGAGRRTNVPYPQITPATLQRMHAYLRPEAEAFLDSIGKPRDFWVFPELGAPA
jgi:hypothetical protein